jgi:16S rRNA G966 N2-methylase RsmD
MRIIAGDLRGRQITAPPGMRTRPMLDRVRQAVFNIVGASYGDPGSVPPVAVLDVFAGSGALGIEALSRGASWCCFVEEDSVAVRTLQGNLKALGLERRAEVVRGSALKVKMPRPPVGGQGTGNRGQAAANNKDTAQAEACTPNEGTSTPANIAAVAPEGGALAGKLPVAPRAYTIVFLDPPYPLSRDSSVRSPVGQLLAKLPELAPLDPAVLVVLRHEAEVHYDGQMYGRFEAIDVRRYGGMAVTFMEMVDG